MSIQHRSAIDRVDDRLRAGEWVTAICHWHAAAVHRKPGHGAASCLGWGRAGRPGWLRAAGRRDAPPGREGSPSQAGEPVAVLVEPKGHVVQGLFKPLTEVLPLGHA